MKKIACLFRGSLKKEDMVLGKMGFELVIDSIKNYLNIEDVVFFMHLWGDCEGDKLLYKDYFKSGYFIVENNNDYFNKISDIERFYISPNRNKKIIWNEDFDNPWTCERVFAQISQAISLKKVCNIFVNSIDFIDCDAVFISRPDLLFSKKIEKNSLESIDGRKIYFNKHGPEPSSGDMCFLMSKQNVFSFSNIINFMKKNPYHLSPRYHLWHYYYVKEICKIDVDVFEPDAGVNCDLLRKFNKDNIVSW